MYTKNWNICVWEGVFDRQTSVLEIGHLNRCLVLLDENLNMPIFKIQMPGVLHGEFAERD